MNEKRNIYLFRANKIMSSVFVVAVVICYLILLVQRKISLDQKLKRYNRKKEQNKSEITTIFYERYVFIFIISFVVEIRGECASATTRSLHHQID